MSGKVNLDRWGPHLLAAQREGKSLTQYARSHGLSRYTRCTRRDRCCEVWVASLVWSGDRGR